MTWLDAWFGGKFPVGPSLAIIGTALAMSIGASLLFQPKNERHRPGTPCVSASRREALDERAGG